MCYFCCVVCLLCFCVDVEVKLCCCCCCVVVVVVLCCFVVLCLSVQLLLYVDTGFFCSVPASYIRISQKNFTHTDKYY